MLQHGLRQLRRPGLHAHQLLWQGLLGRELLQQGREQLLHLGCDTACRPAGGHVHPGGLHLTDQLLHQSGKCFELDGLLGLWRKVYRVGQRRLHGLHDGGQRCAWTGAAGWCSRCTGGCASGGRS